MTPLGVDQWRLFIQIADHGSLTRAAAARDVAQSAVSRQLAAIERQCGGRLFERHGRGVRLTDAGARLYPQVVDWLATADALVRNARHATREPTGTVSLGVLASIGPAFVVRVHDLVRQRLPGVRLRIVEGTGGRLAAWLDCGELDIALLVRNGREGRRREAALAPLTQVLVGPPGDRLTRARTVPFRRIDQLPLVLACGPNAFRLLIDHWARRKGIAINVAIECDPLPTQKALIRAGRVHGILAAHAVRDEIAQGLLQAAPLVDPALQRTMTLASTEARPPTPACRQVAAIVRMIANATFGPAGAA